MVLPPHPLGIKPLGNGYLTSHNLRSTTGDLYRLPEEIWLQILEYLDATSLLRIGETCKALYAFSRFDDLWKTIFLVSPLPSSNFHWQGSWRSTVLGIQGSKVSRIQCETLYSDILYRPFQCAHTSLLPYTTNIPSRNEILRLGNLTSSEFLERWANSPFILTEPVKEWPVYKERWCDNLLQKYSEVEFVAEAVNWPLKQYMEYASRTEDESPLYLFDKGFVEKMKLQVGPDLKADYRPPDCFGEDYFALLGDKRPDSRWLIIGPSRGGSTFHKDPNATSAWNAVLKGSKYWIMFPSTEKSPSPPGVYVSEDQSEVTSPLSIAEWLLEFHSEARRTKGCKEGICRAGEVLHVPSGWWHLVVNLEYSVAITQNFIPRAHLPAALSFLRDKPDQVSGFSSAVTDPYQEFLERLRAYPEVLQEALPCSERTQKRKWEELAPKDTDLGCFTFGFEEDEADDTKSPRLI